MNSREPAANGRPHEEKPAGAASCDACQTELKAYVDGEISPLSRWSVQRHLAGCAKCRAEESLLRRLGEEMKDLDKATPRPELRRRILTSLPDGPPEPAHNRMKITSTRPQARGRLAVAAPLLAAGATLLLMTGALFALHNVAGSDHAQTLAAEETPGQQPQSAAPTFTADLPAQPKPDHNSLETDAINREADAMTTRDLLQERAQALAAQAHRDESPLPADRTDSAAPIRLILTVANAISAPDRLLALTQRLGGHVAAPVLSPLSDLAAAEKQRQWAASHAGGSGPDSAQPPTPQNRTFVADIPIAQANAFQLALKRLGSVTVASSHPASVTGGAPVISPPRSVAPAVPTELPAVEPVPGPSVLPQAPPRPTTVTFVVRIEPKGHEATSLRE